MPKKQKTTISKKQGQYIAICESLPEGLKNALKLMCHPENLKMIAKITARQKKIKLINLKGVKDGI